MGWILGKVSVFDVRNRTGVRNRTLCKIMIVLIINDLKVWHDSCYIFWHINENKNHKIIQWIEKNQKKLLILGCREKLHRNLGQRIGQSGAGI